MNVPQRRWCAVAVMLAALGCGNEPERAAPQGAVAASANATRPILRWGGDAEGGEPYVEADPSDPSKVRGFDVEIAEMIAAGLGREPRFVQAAWAQLEASVERGDFSVALSGLETSAEIAARRSVSLPYMAFREVLSVRPADTLRFRTMADLANRRVAVLGGAVAHRRLLADQARTGTVPVVYENTINPYSDLTAGRVDAVLLDHIVAQTSLKRVGGFVIQPLPVSTSSYVALFARRDSLLRDSANAVLRARMRDGSLERTYRKWGVWDSTQAAHFASVLAADPGAAMPGAASAGDGDSQATASMATYLPALLRAALITLLISVASMVIAVLLGTAIASGRVYGGPVTRAVLATYVEVVRGTPVLLQLFVIYYGLADFVRLPALASAIIGLGLNYAAYESEIYRAALQAVPRAQLEAARTLGFAEWQVLRLVRAPQALRFALAPMTNDFVALLKDSSLVSVITVVELTKQTAIYATNIGSWFVPGLLCAAAYLAMSLPLSRLARRLEQRWSAP